MHHVRVALDNHVFGQLDAADLRHPPGVVASKVEQLDVFGAFFFIRQQIGSQCLIFLEGGAAFARAGNRTHRHRVAFEPDKNLRRGADDMEVLEIEIEHVRRRIQRAQRTVERQRAGSEWFYHALGKDDLHDVALGDVLLGPDHRLFKMRFAEQGNRRLRIARGLGWNLDWLTQACQQLA